MGGGGGGRERTQDNNALVNAEQFARFDNNRRRRPRQQLPSMQIALSVVQEEDGDTTENVYLKLQPPPSLT